MAADPFSWSSEEFNGSHAGFRGRVVFLFSGLFHEKLSACQEANRLEAQEASDRWKKNEADLRLKIYRNEMQNGQLQQRRQAAGQAFTIRLTTEGALPHLILVSEVW